MPLLIGPRTRVWLARRVGTGGQAVQALHSDMAHTAPGVSFIHGCAASAIVAVLDAVTGTLECGWRKCA